VGEDFFFFMRFLLFFQNRTAFKTNKKAARFSRAALWFRGLGADQSFLTAHNFDA
jgi:hypothetical protein